jgi:succinate dehydrogenase / fumarate reductase cytochrome b subunit
VKDVRDALMVARNTDGKLVRRPLSPHVQVYRWPLSMALSILHRVTGVALGVGTLLMTWWLVAAASSDAAFASAEGFIGSPVGLLLLFGWTVALFFHLYSGVRHLVWDAGFGFDAPDYTTSGWAVVIATGVSTVLAWVIGLAVW